MTNEDLAARYETLRAAAAEVVHSALKPRNAVPYTPELHELHRMLLEAQPSAASDGPDPARYSLAFTDYREDGSSAPYELTTLAAEVRADLDGDRSRTEHIPDQPLRNVTLTQLRAMVISSLLNELAARLSPGPAIGLGDGGRDLAEIATDLSTKLLNQTSAGAQ